MLGSYTRVSNEDYDLTRNCLKHESDSLTAQKQQIRAYAQRHFPNEELVEFCDDGYTGTNFDRPAFQRMLELARKGEITCIIVKDLSRFGRDYLEVGNYLDYVFPFLGVRLISINDNYDSVSQTGVTSGLDVSLRNLVYDNYSKDLSKKVRSAQRSRMKRGKYVNVPPYGYVPSPTDKHQLVIDPEAAAIVREIFNRFLNGLSTAEIARELNRRDVPTPQSYKKIVTKLQEGKTIMWTHHAVLSILQCVKYTGTMTNHMVETPYIRAKNYRRIPKSEWIVTEDAHEAIIEKDVFNQAQAKIRKVRPTERTPTGIPNMYYCAHCGRKLGLTHGAETYFSCRSPYNHEGMEQCRSVRWKRRDLEALLMTLFEKQIALLAHRQHEIRRKLAADNPEDFSRELAQLDKELERLSNDKVLYYTKYRDGKIGREDFMDMKQQISHRQEDIAQRQNELRERQKKHAELKEMAREGQLLESEFLACDTDLLKQKMFCLIERVVISGAEEIEVVWKFSDLITAPQSGRQSA